MSTTRRSLLRYLFLAPLSMTPLAAFAASAGILPMPSVDRIRDGFSAIEWHEFVMDYIHINPMDRVAFTANQDHGWDEETEVCFRSWITSSRSDRWWRGDMKRVAGYLWGSTVLLDPRVPQGTVVLVSDTYPEYDGSHDPLIVEVTAFDIRRTDTRSDIPHLYIR